MKINMNNENINNILTADVIDIINTKSATVMKSRGWDIIDPVSIFMGVVMYCDGENHTRQHKYIKNTLYSILKKHKLLDKSFAKSIIYKVFKDEYEMKAGKVMSLSFDEEVDNLVQLLSDYAKEYKCQADIEDLIRILFAKQSGQYSGKLYMFFASVRQELLNNNINFIVENLFDDVNESFKAKQLRYGSLDDIPALHSLMQDAVYNTDEYIGNENEINALVHSLVHYKNKSCCLQAEAGVGKTALVLEVAKRIMNEQIPELKGTIIYEMSISEIKSKSGLVGMLEQQVNAIINAVKEYDNVILFIDEIHMICSDYQDLSIGNLLKTAISSGDIRVIGATTLKEYKASIAKDKALARRMPPVLLQEPNKETTIEIVKAVKHSYESFHGAKLPDALVEKLVDYGNIYGVEFSNPDKSLRLVDDVLAYCKLNNIPEASEEEIINSINLKYGIKASKNRWKDAYNGFKSDLLGQDEVIDKWMHILAGIQTGARTQKRPLDVVLAVGSTGVGKTETGKLLAKYFLGNEKAVIVENMENYSTEFDASRFLGSAPGFVGYEDGTSFTNKIKQYPNAIIVFDEIEKAHQKIHTMLQTALDTGELNAADGSTISLKNNIIIITTNLGCGDSSGIQGEMVNRTEEIANKIKERFAPDFRARFKHIIYYKPLTNDVINKLIDKSVDELNKLSNLNVVLTEDDRKAIIKKSKIETNGARNVAVNVESFFNDIAYKKLMEE